MPTLMTCDAALQALRALSNADPEQAHRAADAMLCAVLRTLGAGDVVDAWEQAMARIGFWYA